jgi:hypothetical protein
MRYKLTIKQSRPFFAEIPYYIWGEINYDSEGDCKYPTDRTWTWICLTNRENSETMKIYQGIYEEIKGDMVNRVKDPRKIKLFWRDKGEIRVLIQKSDEDIKSKKYSNAWIIEAKNTLASRAVRFLKERCNATNISPILSDDFGDWDYDKAVLYSEKVRETFQRKELKPFDNVLFWGSWKWISWFATEPTWVGRWIMHSIITKDLRAVPLCCRLLKDEDMNEIQSMALRYAIEYLTGVSLKSGKEYVRWYYKKKGKKKYPEPDYDSWLENLKIQFDFIGRFDS